MIRRKAAALLLLVCLPFAVGCDVHEGTSVSWSPSGGRVAFLAKGRPWIYELGTGKLQRVATSLETQHQLAWSSQEGLIAVSSDNVVQLLVEDNGVFAASTTFTVPSTRIKDSILIWNPARPRLLLVQDREEQGLRTTEIVVPTGAADTAPGVAAYGPSGDWVFWMNGAPLGHQEDRTVSARESLERAALPLSDADQGTLGDSGVEALWFYGNPLCFSQKHDEAKVLCFDAAGALRQRAVLPAELSETPYVSRAQDRFAVMLSTPAVLDAKGRTVARGVGLLRELRREFPETEDRYQSNVAWSPDGNWLAWVLQDRLVLWNWRNDVARVLPPLE